jgi:uncharacterized protein YegL
LPSLRKRVATLTGREECDVLVSEDSAHVVSNGAAEEAYYRDDSDHVMPGGIGLRMRDESGSRVNRVYLRPNHIVPAGGMQVEQMGQLLDSPGGHTLLWLEPFVAKPSVRCADPLLGVSVLLDDREIVPLKELHPEIDLPAGRHEVRLGISIDANRSTNLVITLDSLPDYEPIVVPLSLSDSGPALREEVRDTLEIAIVFDCSRSMEGQKFVQAKRAVEHFVRDVSPHGIRMTLIRMGGGSGKVAVVVPLTADSQVVIDAMAELNAVGGTHMTEALALTEKTLAAGDPGASKMAIVFSDGMPHSATSAVAQANSLKTNVRVVCVGIGNNALRPVLELIASSEDDYFEAEAPSDILGCLYSVAELVHTVASAEETFAVKSA